MRIIRLNDNHIEIFPEEEQHLFEEMLGWRDKGTLNSIICELKGYSVKDEEDLS